jgi:hypothetical protein
VIVDGDVIVIATVIVVVHLNGNATLIVIPTFDEASLVDGRSIRITVGFPCTCTATASDHGGAHVADHVDVHG